MIFVFRRKSGEGEGPAAQTDQNFEELAGSMKAANLLELDQVVESLTARLHQPLS